MYSDLFWGTAIVTLVSLSPAIPFVLGIGVRYLAKAAKEWLSKL